MRLPETAMGRKTFWLRLGDNADYQSGSLDGHLDRLQESLMYLTLFRHGDYGLSCEKYQGNNYISLFVGDSEAQPVRPITDKELEYLNYWLNKVE